jgi:2-keto-4-pentenoate hydratase/2-oxohepta-3-ene-1,7-dioic acid hydratase in catechol pathway
MKLATFQVNTPLGPVDRFGIVHLDQDGGWVIDVNMACLVMAHADHHHAPYAWANAMAPADISRYCELYGVALDPLHRIVNAMTPSCNIKGARATQGPGGEQVIWPLSEVRLRPPFTKVPVLRDFAAFEDHLHSTFSRMGLKIPPVWYEQPTAFKGNSTSLFGHEDQIVWPRYTEKLDYELEIAAVIGRPGRNLSHQEANGHILGYTLLNDFSARDTQRGEMAISTGPFKGKDFAWGLGPWIVTLDELGDPATLKMSVRINGEIWAESTPGEMQWSFPEAVSYTSQDETLNIGDVIGSGTVNRGCGFEIDRWIKPGDIVELVADRIGTLRHRIALKSSEPAVVWRHKTE